MKMRLYSSVILSVVAMLLIGFAASASPVAGVTNTWNSGNGTWANTLPYGQSYGTLANDPAVGNQGVGSLKLSFPGNMTPEDDTIYTTDTAYKGDYSAVSLQFSWRESFDAVTTLFFESGLNRWEWSFDNTVLNTWQQYTVAFDDWSAEGWSGPQASFLAGVAAIDVIGIVVSSGTTSPQNYWLDDWGYTDDNPPEPPVGVPEPGTVCMLGAVFLSFGTAFRKRFSELFTSAAS